VVLVAGASGAEVADSAVHLLAVAFGGPVSAEGSSALLASHFDLLAVASGGPVSAEGLSVLVASHFDLA
jgi:hypothetical protein